MTNQITKNINFLLNNPKLSTTPYNFPEIGKFFSNCMGTAFFIHNLIPQKVPIYIEGTLPSVTKLLNSDLFEQKQIQGSIFHLLDYTNLSEENLPAFHSAIFLKKEKENIISIFEQTCIGYRPESKFQLTSTKISPNLEQHISYYYPIKEKIGKIQDQIKIIARESIEFMHKHNPHLNPNYGLQN